MNVKELFSQFRNLLSNAAGVEMSFGQPSQIGDMHIIPVAKVSFGFGGGGGKSPKKGKKADKDVANSPETTIDGSEKNEEDSVGVGGGGGVKTEPIGIYNIKDDVVKFHPIIGIKELLAIIAIISVFLIRFKKINCKGK